MKFRSTLLPALCIFFLARTVSAQTYCSPAFAYGCTLWSNQAITLGTINWTLVPYYCDVSDYTSMSTALNAGSSYQMDVTNGNWCGCGVWVDFNQDFAFDTTEALFHLYTALETNNFSFQITIPSNVPTGSYRMRVIAGWGTDCYSVSANGYGPCGSYQYGNFDDFTLDIQGIATEVSNIDASSSFQIFPNPATDYFTISLGSLASPGAEWQLVNSIGQIVYRKTLEVNNGALTNSVDLGGLKGIYLVRVISGGTASEKMLILD